MNHIFKISQLNISYKDRQILVGAEAFGNPGEMIGLLGESGSGKTSIAKVLCGVLKAESGEVQTPKVPKVQMIYQNPWGSLDPVQKIGEGFKEIFKYHKLGLPEEQLPKILSEVDLGEDILTHLPSQISGGEAARVCIARALLFKPELLIMDEATSMLDTDTQREIIALVKEIVCKKGGCVLFISHDEETVKGNCNRIYILKEKVLREA